MENPYDSRGSYYKKTDPSPTPTPIPTFTCDDSAEPLIEFEEGDDDVFVAVANSERDVVGENGEEEADGGGAIAIHEVEEWLKPLAFKISGVPGIIRRTMLLLIVHDMQTLWILPWS